ncbi:MAG: cysteine--tRNA ligase [Magnetococcus sp. DMHC-6]
MAIALYCSLSHKKKIFVPLTPGKVGIYVCGVTVYDHSHIGHARVMVVFDVIVRHLRASGYQVTYVRNFTDIDDKIIRRAAELGENIFQLTGRFIESFHTDMAALGVARADVEPRATDHLEEMILFIQKLQENGLAYESQGDVFYAVDRFAQYGQLSGKSIEDLISGSRVEIDQRKANPLDFVLWKGAKPQEPHWPSPWGAGRPGWHIECSAMSCKYLGETFDIHGGGQDLIFPHHENEIAQTQGVTGKSWVSYWLHNGFVNVVSDGGEVEKMSKSLGNFFTIHELLTKFPGPVLRLFILGSHYRSPLEFSFQHLQTARAKLDRLYGALQRAKSLLGMLPPAEVGAWEAFQHGALHTEAKRFQAAMDDDFNTPQALAVLFEVARLLNRSVDEGSHSTKEEIQELARFLRQFGAVLGIATDEPEHWFAQTTPHAAENDATFTDAEIQTRIDQRQAARLARDFAQADHIRQELLAHDIELLDSRTETTWRRLR